MQEQQARQQEIQTVKEEISKKDQEILSLESQLKEAEKLLVSLNKRCHDDLKMILGAFHDAKDSENFSWNSNGKVRFGYI